MNDSPVNELLGKTVGHYRVVDLLGKGGMGEVYVGFDEKLERRVALKSIRAERRMDGDAKARFLHEARVLSQLEHPGICQIFDYLEEEESDFLVLELIRGKTLTRAIKDGLDQEDSLQIVQEISEVLAIAHDQGIVHRDLKPDNVMLTETGAVKVLDFGLSRTLTEEETVALRSLDTLEHHCPSVEAVNLDEDQTIDVWPEVHRSDDSSVQTEIGAVLGTIGYMSPEQARGEQVTATSDIYSLGVMLQEFVTGEAPYECGPGGFVEKLDRVRSGEVPVIRGVDDVLANLIREMRAAIPADRPTATEVGSRLVNIRARPKRRRMLLLSLLTTACFLALAVVAMLIQETRSRQRDLAQIRTGLENAAAADRSPLDMEPDWESLSPILLEAITAEADKELLVSVLRAEMRVEAEVRPYYKLGSDAPLRWNNGKKRVFPKGIDASKMELPIVHVVIEARSERSDWVEIGDSMWLLGKYAGGSASCSLPPAVLGLDSLGKYLVQTRARYSVYRLLDVASVAGMTATQFVGRSGCNISCPPSMDIEIIPGRQVLASGYLYEDEDELLMVEEFPENYPKPVMPAEGDQERLRFKEVRIHVADLDLPGWQQGSEVVFDLRYDQRGEWAAREKTSCEKDCQVGQAGFEIEAPESWTVPMAGALSVVCGTTERALFESEMVFDQGILTVKGARGSHGEEKRAIVQLGPEDIWEEHPCLSESREVMARVNFIPDRDIAIDNGLDTYFAFPLTDEVKLSIRVEVPPEG